MKTICNLCQQRESKLFYEDFSEEYRSTYYLCGNCYIIFVPPKYRPTVDEELDRYDQHENDPEDERYRSFLGRLFEPMNKMIYPNSKGLDFGSGPGPTLHKMFEEQGHDMRIYDPFYANDSSLLENKYDFITLTEVAEHLHHPHKEFERLWNCLHHGGHLGVMTQLAKVDEQFFADWYYRLDNTHVTFYTKDSFHWMADQWSASLTFFDNNVVIFEKN